MLLIQHIMTLTSSEAPIETPPAPVAVSIQQPFQLLWQRLWQFLQLPFWLFIQFRWQIAAPAALTTLPATVVFCARCVIMPATCTMKSRFPREILAEIFHTHQITNKPGEYACHVCESCSEQLTGFYERRDGLKPLVKRWRSLVHEPWSIYN